VTRRLLFVLSALALLLAGGVASAGVALAGPSGYRVPGSAARVRPAIGSISPAAGPVAGGTKIDVRGSGFKNVEWVSVGGKRTDRFQERSSRLLVVRAPRHAAGTAAIIVDAASGRSKPSAVRFHYVSRPSVTGLSAHSGPVTGGQVVTIRGRALSYLRAVHFGKLAAKIAGSSSTRLRVRVPASWAGRVQVTVTTAGGTSAGTPATRFTFKNPAPSSTAKLTAASGAVVAAGTDVSAVTGGVPTTTSTGVTQTPWQVMLASGATLPAVGQEYVLEPGGSAYPGGLAGTVTAVDTSGTPVTITVAPPASLAATMQSATVDFSGPIGDGPVPADSSQHPMVMYASRRPAAAQSDLLGTIDFGAIPAGALECKAGAAADLSGSLNLTLTNVEAHVQVDLGSLVSKPSADVWISFQPTVTASLTATAEVDCSLSDTWQEAHQALFVLGDTGISVAIAPAASFTVNAGGTITVSQHSYRILGFETNPDGSISRIDSSSSDPAVASASATLTVDASAGVQIQVGELNVIGVGMSLDGGIKGAASEPWPPQLCLGITPYLSGSVYGYLNVWITEWKLTAFSAELDLGRITACVGTGWHDVWQSSTASVAGLACPSVSDCYGVGSSSNDGYVLTTTNHGQSWHSATLKSASFLSSVACTDTSHCVIGGESGYAARVFVTATGGSSWTEVTLPRVTGLTAAGVEAVACVSGGSTCYVATAISGYTGNLIFGTTDSGQKWTYINLVQNELDAMTCVSASSCVWVGEVTPQNALVGPGVAESTKNGWATYTVSSLPKPWWGLTGVGCLNTSVCFAAGFDQDSATGVILTTSNFGKTWSTASDDGVAPWSVSCPSSTNCVLGAVGAVVETTDGGQSWTVTSTPNSGDTYSLACPSTGYCMAVQNNGDTTAIVSS